jgi:hypothetical protein
MPLQTCVRDEQVGYQYGDNGHCYIGPNSRKNALRAAAENGASNGMDRKEFFEIISELDFEEQVQLTLAYNAKNP